MVGPTNRSLERTIRGIRVVNLGSVSVQVNADKRASYVIVSADDTGVQLIRRRVSYDRAQVLDRLERSRHPGRNFIAQYLRDS